MRSATAHELDEVPVLAGTVTVALDVADELRVGLTSGIETERGLNLLVLQVAVDGLGATDNLYAILLGSIVLGQNTSVGVRVVATDDNQCLDAELLEDLITCLELALLLQLGTARTDDVETTGVAVLVDELVGELNILVVNQTTRTHQEAIELAVLVERLDTVIKTADNIVTTRSLTARENDTYVDSGIVLALGRNKLYYGHTIGIGEEGLDFLLVANTLSSGTFLSLYSTLKGLGQLRLVSCSCNLQCTFFHLSKNLLNVVIQYSHSKGTNIFHILGPLSAKEEKKRIILPQNGSAACIYTNKCVP